jgi:hypothetical protein
MEHAPYSPDLTPSDYHMFSRLKKILAGQRFISDYDTILFGGGFALTDRILQQPHLQTSDAMGQMPESWW